MHVLNIGLMVGNNAATVTAAAALLALRQHGAEVEHHELAQSDTEPTLVCTVKHPLDPDAAHAISAALSQEAIAQWTGGQGELYGPGADAWRPFNPAYFLMPVQTAQQVAA